MFKKIGQIFSSLSIIVLGALLGAIGGQGYKEVRRFIYPSIVTMYAYFLLQNWLVFTCYAIAGALSIGYGTVSPDDDKPSFLGKIAYKLFPKSQITQNIFCRGLVGKLLSLSMFSVPLITHNWVSYVIGSWMIILIWGVVSWRSFGETKVKILRKEISLLNVDLITYAVTTLGFIIMINGWLK